MIFHIGNILQIFWEKIEGGLRQWFVYSNVGTRAPSQYPKRRLSVRSRKVSKPRDLYLELSDRSEIWQALRQQCCRCACQISKRYDNLKYQSRGFETLRDLTKRRLFGYWDGAQNIYNTQQHLEISVSTETTRGMMSERYHWNVTIGKQHVESEYSQIV